MGRCTLTTGEKDVVQITIEDSCSYNQSQCRDGRCMNPMAFCNGRRDCADGSDEDPIFCEGEFYKEIAIKVTVWFQNRQFKMSIIYHGLMGNFTL